VAGPPAVSAQSAPGWGRISLFGSWDRTSASGGLSSDFSVGTASLTLRSASADDGGAEYAVDLRGAAYPSGGGRSNEWSIYDAWVGGRLPQGVLGLRLGQMWINELGSLGSVAGALIHYQQPEAGAAGRLRAGVFGGLEPEILQPGYARDVRKYGGFLALDGENARTHVVGYTQIRDLRVTERSVVTMMNFVPIGRKFFLYQAAEYDIAKPGGLGKSGLNYLFANVRYAPSAWLEIQGLYHHGRSIDARTISQDILNGRPVDARTIEGFLFESVGGRLTFSVAPSLRVFGGYSRERDNGSDRPYGRTTAGIWASDVFGTGVDVSLSDSRSNRPGTTYDSWYASIGRNIGSRFYLSADYSTSLSVLRFQGPDGVSIVSQPRSRRVSLYALWNVDRHFSVTAAGERLREDNSTDDRVRLGLVLRF
jgi:hypothetical protein